MDSLERRRLQNRIAQRNHRTRMKEKGLSGKPNNEPPSQANEPRLDRLQGSTTSFDPVGQFAYSGDQFLPMSDIPDGNHCLNEFGFAFPDTELSMQAFSESKDMPYASIHGSQNSDRSHASEVYGDADPLAEDLFGKDPPPPQPPCDVTQNAPNMHLSPFVQHRSVLPAAAAPRLSDPSRCVDISANRGVRLPSGRMKEHGGLAQRSAVNGSGSTQRSSTHCRFDPSAIANQSEKYQYILECVHNSGFADFDDMVVGYYTSAFARGSLADRAQKTSRARRLQSMLSQLYRCSQGWTTWEARGIQAEIVAAAEEIYVADFHRLAADLGPFPTEQLEEVKNSRSDAVLNGGNLEAGVLGDLRQLYQNKIPNVWALGTELAGASGSQAQDATVLALSLLHCVRADPKADLKEFIATLLYG